MTTGTMVGIGATLLVGGTIAYLLYQKVKAGTGSGSVAARNADGEWEENHKTLEAAGRNPKFSGQKISHMANGDGNMCAAGRNAPTFHEFSPAGKVKHMNIDGKDMVWKMGAWRNA